MKRKDLSAKSPKVFAWCLLGFAHRPRTPDEISVELRKLEEYEPPAEMGEGDRKKHLEEKELARSALLDELRASERLKANPSLKYAQLVFWCTAILTAILIWLAVRK
jgi:hypothetical protein